MRDAWNESSGNISIYYKGLLDYTEARELQETWIDKRIAGEIGDRIICCEHPSVITLGRRSSEKEFAECSVLVRDLGAEIYKVSRGGEATFHGPGQLIIYPIINLKKSKLGVSKFVENGLKAIENSIKEIGINARGQLKPAGVWVNSSHYGDWAKIASVGLEFRRGVSNHGFSLNCACDLRPFFRFTPCGLKESVFSSLALETGQHIDSIEDIAHDLLPKMTLDWGFSNVHWY